MYLHLIREVKSKGKGGRFGCKPFCTADSACRYAYDFDDIGNREFSSERGTNSVYTANKLNQYTAVDDFTPQFDADGNQTLIKTATGIWQVSYNGENRPIHWSNGLTNIVMSFDRMGRRVTKNAQRFVYDGYLQIANFEHSTSNIELQTFIWDPTEPVATRPLVWNRSGTSSFYTHDGNKNVSEAVSENGQIAAHYECEPFGAVSSQYGESASSNPWRFSCEYAEDDTALVYYNSRHYESICGRWISRDLIEESGGVNLYSFCVNAAILRQDRLGFSWVISRKGEIYAEACADSLNDDFESLAEVLSLNDYEYQKWAQTNDMLPKRGKIYKIPNVMVMYASKPQWVKDGVLSLAYRLRRKVREEADAYENEGFYVKRYWLYDSEEEFISAWCLPGIYAISIAGHGTVYGYKAEPSSDSAVSPHEVSILYHLASVHAYFCYSADDIVDPNGKVMSWRYLVSHNGSFLGYLGVGWHWSDQFTDDNHLDD